MALVVFVLALVGASVVIVATPDTWPLVFLVSAVALHGLVTDLVARSRHRT